MPAHLAQYGTCTVMMKNGWAWLSLDWKSSASDSWGKGDIGTLPVGYRPATDISFKPIVFNAVNNKSVNICKTGNVNYNNAGGSQDGSGFLLHAAWPLP